MAMMREQVEAEARRLPREERARLAEALIASLDEEAEIERAWSAEIARRVQELQSGAVTSIPAGEVFAELEGLLKE
jgi:putative addiction module component (TIGR02574 family)